MRELALHSGVKEQRLVVLDDELVELELVVGVVGRNAVDVRCDLGDVRHDSLLKRNDWHPAAMRIGHPGSGPALTSRRADPAPRPACPFPTRLPRLRPGAPGAGAPSPRGSAGGRAPTTRSPGGRGRRGWS